jgi:hypothetical protein
VTSTQGLSTSENGQGIVCEFEHGEKRFTFPKGTPHDEVVSTIAAYEREKTIYDLSMTATRESPSSLYGAKTYLLLTVFQKPAHRIGEKLDEFIDESPTLLKKTAEQTWKFVTENFYKTLSLVEEKRKEWGIYTTRLLEPIFAVNVAEAISFESDPEMQVLWAILITNAIDPRFEKKKIRIEFIGVLKEMSPLDAKILNCIAKKQNGETPMLQYIFKTFSNDKILVDASIYRLKRAGLIEIPLISAYGSYVAFDLRDPETYGIFHATKITLQGEEFLRAISPPDKPENG